ncbi:hypothetical protein TRICI_002242 [Trichomonascus ciferrii]|uniref:Zn(2)-C6 fungal-type domain-containing protein n=1 Tax=Trichomonascus ciferrii TaxID=44093 RepID=A0A642V758_9ASCO|nr:hypothetical protein TRICI_002242 [Trichomonascus ciferrii]
MSTQKPEKDSGTESTSNVTSPTGSLLAVPTPARDQQRRLSGGSTGSEAGSPQSVKMEDQSGGGNSHKGKKRRPHSKSRRGCATCKRRRVKCDETHPICKNCEHMALECSFNVGMNNASKSPSTGPNGQVARGSLNMMDIRLFYHYTTESFKTIVQAGIQNDKIWGSDVPMLAFDYPFLMHSILMFAATHLSRTHRGVPDNVITVHRGDALRLLREEVKRVNEQNLDALVAASILLILDSLANASTPDTTSVRSLPASAWLHHVRGAATILLSVCPLPPESRFYKLVNVELSDLAEPGAMPIRGVSNLQCFDDDVADLYPVHTTSPYYQTLAYLDKIFHQRYKADFILRVFAFPALLDRNLIELLIKGDHSAKRIIKVYYKLVRSFTAEMKESVWFLEGVSKVLPIDMDSEYGGLGFITNALPVVDSLEKVLEGFDASILAGMNVASDMNLGVAGVDSGNRYEAAGLTEINPSDLPGIHEEREPWNDVLNKF